MGYVRPVEMDELLGPLDIYEEVSGAGLYRRVQTTTRASGRVALCLFSAVATVCTGTDRTLASAGGRTGTWCIRCGRPDVGHVDSKKTEA